MTNSTHQDSLDERRGIDEWATYDEFAAGIDTYRLPNVSLDGKSFTFKAEGAGTIQITFGTDEASWVTDGAIALGSAQDPYDAVQVREGVYFVNLPLTSQDGLAITIVWSEHTGRAILTVSRIESEQIEGQPQVQQDFYAATVSGLEASGAVPAESRDLIGMRNLYRYSPNHLYEHMYVSTERYAWQNLEGVQRGHGDMDLSTVWKLDEGLYLFCFREFRISVASVWLHDLGYDLRTTGIFLGLNGEGVSEHSRAGGHIYPLGTVKYPDSQPV